MSSKKVLWVGEPSDIGFALGGTNYKPVWIEEHLCPDSVGKANVVVVVGSAEELDVYEGTLPEKSYHVSFRGVTCPTKRKGVPVVNGASPEEMKALVVLLTKHILYLLDSYLIPPNIVLSEEDKKALGVTVVKGTSGRNPGVDIIIAQGIPCIRDVIYEYKKHNASTYVIWVESPEYPMPFSTEIPPEWLFTVCDTFWTWDRQAFLALVKSLLAERCGVGVP